MVIHIMFLLLIAASVKVKKKYQDPQYSHSVLLAKHLVLDVDLFKAMMWVCVQKCACLYRCVCISLCMFELMIGPRLV